jgi:hypothetical protein
MKKEFIPYEQALDLKELGFDEKCYGYFTRDEEFFYFDVDDLSSAYTKNMDNLVVNSVNGLECTAPLKQQAFRWFREKYNLFGHIEVEHNNSFYWYIKNPEQFISSQKSDAYEEAELECLKKLIEIIKQK